jgi:hypothetical protein
MNFGRFFEKNALNGIKYRLNREISAILVTLVRHFDYVHTAVQGCQMA